ncbi:hypothetical protein ACWEVD_22715 [Nocardia thailandica]|uniref:hypothetical protein n=1 Tax=Nocardia thailandica TaxID=257275 RepID=UPI00031F02D8|nr:hypothetical protein [Nocardia thailandica]
MDEQSRRIRGFVVFPADAPRRPARLRIELRDVSFADGPAPLLAELSADVPIGPGARFPFELTAPAGAASSAQSLACHVDLTGDGSLATGDLVSTLAIPVPPRGAVANLIIPVTVVEARRNA